VRRSSKRDASVDTPIGLAARSGLAGAPYHLRNGLHRASGEEYQSVNDLRRISAKQKKRSADQQHYVQELS
jgi:hypothetical protein